MLSWALPAPLWESQSAGWGGERICLGCSAPDTELLTSCCCSCFPGPSPRKAGVLPGTLTAWELEQ